MGLYSKTSFAAFALSVGALSAGALSIGGLGATAAHAQASTATAMKPFYTTTDTDIGTLLDTPATRAIIDKILPEFATNPQIDQARPLTFRVIQQFAPDKLPTDKLDALDVAFAKLPAPAK